MRHFAHLDTTHKLLPAEMNTFGGREVLHIVREDGTEETAGVGYSCMIRGVFLLAFDLSRAGGIIPDYLLVVPSTGRVMFVEAKSPKEIRKKKNLLQSGQALLKSLVGDMFRTYENQPEVRAILLEITGNQDYDDWRSGQ